MDELVTGPLETGALRFELQWESDEASGSAAEATRGKLLLLLDDVVVWPYITADEGFSWTWIELVEFLAQEWPWLEWEDGIPFGIAPQEPACVVALASNQWATLSTEVREERESQVSTFLESHDLAQAVQGADLPSVLIVKDGLDCWVCTSNQLKKLRHDSVLASLKDVAERILDRLDCIHDLRAECARKQWDDRSRLDLLDRIEVATGLSPEMLRRLERGEGPGEWWQADPDEFALNEVMAAARMARPLPESTVALVLDSVRNTPAMRTPVLDQLADEALCAVSATASQRVFDQGYALAGWLRAQICTERDRMDPAALLQEWGVRVQDLHLCAAEIDAFACWGPGHGPAVFLNLDGRHNSSEGGRRATLAHEIAHLLLDRQGALPLAEVLGGSVSPAAESRARAFAAEFLLPREVAGAAIQEVPDDVASVVKRLTRRYGVSRQVVAWQVRNSGVPLTDEIRRYLQRLVPDAGPF